MRFRATPALALLLALAAGAQADDSTNLAVVARNGDWSRAGALLAQGADVHARDGSGWTALHAAAFAGRIDIAEQLLARGADVNARTKSGNTPLEWGVQGGKKDIAAFLIVKGATLPRITQDELALRWPNLLFEQTSNPRELLDALARQLKNRSDDESRRLVIRFALRIKPSPAIPEEARRHFVAGSTIVQAGKSPGQQELAVQSFKEALDVAPWWDDAYYNLAVAQELAGKFDDAEKSLRFFMISNPGEKERREALDRIYGLEAKRKLSGAK